MKQTINQQVKINQQFLSHWWKVTLIQATSNSTITCTRSISIKLKLRAVLVMKTSSNWWRKIPRRLKAHIDPLLWILPTSKAFLLWAEAAAGAKGGHQINLNWISTTSLIRASPLAFPILAVLTKMTRIYLIWLQKQVRVIYLGYHSLKTTERYPSTSKTASTAKSIRTHPIQTYPAWSVLDINTTNQMPPSPKYQALDSQTNSTFTTPQLNAALLEISHRPRN